MMKSFNFAFPEFFEKKSYIPNPWNTLRRSKHQLNSIKPKQEKLEQNTRNKDGVRLQNHRKLDQYRSSPSLLGPDSGIRTGNKRRSEGDKYFPSNFETGADVLQYTSKRNKVLLSF